MKINKKGKFLITIGSTIAVFATPFAISATCTPKGKETKPTPQPGPVPGIGDQEKAKLQELQKVLVEIEEKLSSLKNLTVVKQTYKEIVILKEELKKPEAKYETLKVKVDQISKNANELLTNSIKPVVNNETDKEYKFFDGAMEIDKKVTDEALGYYPTYVLDLIKKQPTFEKQKEIFEKFHSGMVLLPTAENNISLELDACEADDTKGLTLVFRFTKEGKEYYSSFLFDQVGKNNRFNPNEHHFTVNKKFVFWNGELTIDAISYESEPDFNELHTALQTNNQKMEAKEFEEKILVEFGILAKVEEPYVLEKSSEGRKVEYQVDSEKSHAHGDKEYHYVLKKFVNGELISTIQGTIGAKDANPSQPGIPHEDQSKIEVGNLIVNGIARVEAIKDMTASEFMTQAREFAKTKEYLVSGIVPKEKIEKLDGIFKNEALQKEVLTFVKKYWDVQGEIEMSKYAFFFDFAYGHPHGLHDYHIMVYIKDMVTQNVSYKDFHISTFYWAHA
ncbi:hypothetical protein ACJA25_01195 [Mycoplasmopsis hyopharyngis]|uniref:hypothetical protein n=1 Tax=Mycoplasmopsis hyopharyngis TaxID=29558 RepID=UPI003873116A